MTDQQPEPEPEQPYQLPDTEPALEPGHEFPEWPMTAVDAAALVPKIIG